MGVKWKVSPTILAIARKENSNLSLVKVFHMVSCIPYRLQADVADLQVNQLLSSLIRYS